MLYIGLMSGTSMDGIDAVLMHCPENALVCGLTKKYSAEIIARLESMKTGVTTLADICQLNTLIGREFAGAVQDLLEKAGVSAKSITAIGSHGQTVCHNTQTAIPYTMQLGCAHTIASLTGIKVIADFRTKDIVNGGQGAPFAPLYHQELFSKYQTPLAVINIGGISNITYIDSQGHTRGWDIGPGNCLMDAWIQKYANKSYDVEGLWARSGLVIEALLIQLLADPFFKLEPPKSLGKEYFSNTWLHQYIKETYKPEDIQATLLALTAYTIAQTIKNIGGLSALYLCGGGVHNTYLVDFLRSLLPECKLYDSAEVGLHPDYLEGMMFAWFAYKTVNQTAVDLSAITGSKCPAILGAVYY